MDILQTQLKCEHNYEKCDLMKFQKDDQFLKRHCELSNDLKPKNSLDQMMIMKLFDTFYCLLINSLFEFIICSI